MYTQHGLAEVTIKRFYMVAWALVMRTNLPLSALGYAISHAALLIRFQTQYQSTVLCVPDGNWI